MNEASRQRVDALIIALADVLRHDAWMPGYLRQVMAALGAALVNMTKN